MDWAGLRRQLIGEHSGDQRDVAYLQIALADAERALDQLARMGHQFHLEPGPGSPLAEWPRMMFHVTSAPNGRLIRSVYEQWDLGDGWCDSLEEAQIRDGEAQQFRGRAGVNRRALPVVRPELNPEPRDAHTGPTLGQIEREKRRNGTKS